MASPRSNVFARSAGDLRSHFAALAVTVVAASVIVAFDLGTSASAAQRLDADQAVSSARDQGFEGVAVETTARYDRVIRRMVWDVRSAAEHAVIDAETGELLALDF